MLGVARRAEEVGRRAFRRPSIGRQVSVLVEAVCPQMDRQNLVAKPVQSSRASHLRWKLLTDWTVRRIPPDFAEGEVFVPSDGPQVLQRRTERILHPDRKSTRLNYSH